MTLSLVCVTCQHTNRDIARFCGMCGQAIKISPALHSTITFTAGVSIGDYGRYRVERLLGGGGFGEAYLAHDTRMDRPCVIKRLVVQPEWTASHCRAIVASFAHESRLLTLLNHPGHPNIPEIYEYVPDHHALVMKYIEGESLLQRLQRRNEPLPETEALTYIHAICSALAYMHSRTPDPVLHRDIKPANIMLDTTGRVWLIDFGLAHALPSNVLQSTAINSLIAGTLGYTPPEQWRGAAEARSDVYALAATFYELLTLHRPPHADLEVRIPIQQLNPLVRPDVEALIEQGMALSPDERPDAAAFLATIEQLQSHVIIAKPPAPMRPPSVVAPLGREHDLDTLIQRLNCVGIVALTGMAGVGKTTLAATLVARFVAPQRLFWYRCQPDEGSEDVLWALAALLAHNGQDSAWCQLQTVFQTGGHTLPPDLLADYLLNLLQGQGYLLCFEDVHQLPTSAHSLLRRLSDAASCGQIRLVLTARCMPPMVPDAAVVTLHGIGQEATHTLLQQHAIVLSTALVERLHRATGGNPHFLTLAIRALLNRADAVALVEQMEQLYRDAPRKPIGTQPLDDAPASDLLAEGSELEQYLLNNVDASLTDDERHVMEALSVLLGDGGTRDVIEALLETANLRRTLNTLCTHQLLTIEQRAGGSVYYQHATVQAFYLRQLRSRTRRTYHQRAAAFYEHEERDLFRAARHAKLAGNYDSAARLLVMEPWSLINAGNAHAVAELCAEMPFEQMEVALRTDTLAVYGEIMLTLGDHRQACERLEQSIAGDAPATAADKVRYARRYRLLAAAYERLGNYERALTMVQRGLVLASEPSSRRSESARLYAQRAEIALRQGALDEGITACRAGLSILPPEPANASERVLLLQRLATLEGDRGNYRVAIDLLEQTLIPARRIGDTLLLATVLNNLGKYCVACGNNERARTCYTESIELNTKLGNQTGCALTLSNLGLLHLATGERLEALRCFHDCLTLSENLDLPYQRELALSNLGVLHYEDGQLDDAYTYLTQAMLLAETLGDNVSHVLCRYLLGDVAIAQEHYADALTHGHLALDLAKRGNYQSYAACALRVIGEAHLGIGDLDAAHTLLSEADTLQAQIGDPYDQALITGARARLAAACQHSEDACDLAHTALEQARLQAIPHLERAMRKVIERCNE